MTEDLRDRLLMFHLQYQQTEHIPAQEYKHWHQSPLWWVERQDGEKSSELLKGKSCHKQQGCT